MNRFYAILILCGCLISQFACQAQFFSNLVTDTDFKVRLLNEDTVSLTDQLDSGKIVILLLEDYDNQEFFDYLGTNTLQTFNDNYGLEGTNQVAVYILIGASNIYQINGSSSNYPLNWVSQVGNLQLLRPGDQNVIMGQPQASFAGIKPYPQGISTTRWAFTPGRKLYFLHNLPTLLELENLLNIYDPQTGINNASVAWANINTFDHCAGEQRTGKVWLSNNGSAPLTSAKLGVSWNGVEQTTFTWTGNLPTYRHTLLDSLLGSYVNLDNSDGTIGVYIKSANGFPDAEAKNDSMFFDTKAAVEVGSQEVTVEWKTSSFTYYTYIDILTESGDYLLRLGDSLIASGNQPSSFADTFLNHTVYTYNIDLADHGQECIKLRCFDLYGSDCGEWIKLISEGDTLIKITGPTGSLKRHEKLFTTTFVPTNDIVKIPLQIYPNPSDGMASVVATLPNQENATLSVVNTLGQTAVKQVVIGTGSPQTWEIDTTPFANGVYFVVLHTNLGSSSMVLVVQR